MSGKESIGFIGFGEAVSSILEGFYESGQLSHHSVYVYYHRLQEHSAKVKRMKLMAETYGVTLCSSLEELSRHVEYVINLTTASAALQTAREVLTVIQPGQIYADLNSAGPEVKARIASWLKEKSVGFVDGTVMAPVPMRKHRVPILVCGDGAARFVVTMSKLGMQITDMEAEAGSASAVKMVRSIFMKGIAAVLMETYLVAKVQGDSVYRNVFESLDETFSKTSFQQLTNRLILGTLQHAGRRSEEMEQSIAMADHAGLKTVMSSSTHQFLRNIASRPPDFIPEGIEDPQIIAYLFDRFSKEEKREVQERKETGMSFDG